MTVGRLGLAPRSSQLVGLIRSHTWRLHSQGQVGPCRICPVMVVDQSWGALLIRWGVLRMYREVCRAAKRVRACEEGE